MMHKQDVQTHSPGTAKEAVTLLVGNPNVGKSILFGILTGRYATVSNYPGTTVELTQGRHRYSGGMVIDLPGANNLIPNSEDEQVTRDVLLEHLGEKEMRVVQVCDAKNLRRGILMTLQLAELEVPMVLVANMLDEALSRGWEFDAPALQTTLGVPVLEAIAIQRRGTTPLLSDGLDFRAADTHQVTYSPSIEKAIEKVQALLPAETPGKRGLAVMLLADGPAEIPWARHLPEATQSRLEAIHLELAQRLPEPVRFTINRARLTVAERIADGALRRTGRARNGWLGRLGDLALHPVWGLPVAAVILYLLYLFVGVLGAGTAVDFLESTVFAQYLTPWMDKALRLILPDALEGFLVGPLGSAPGSGPGLLIGSYGLFSMGLSYAFAIVLPIVGFFFIAFSLLEDSGYLPRLAVMLNRFFKLMGLNGKAVLPMILGLGCDTMATMTARILTTRKERVIVTLLLALGVPCSAQLGVILGMMAALSAKAMFWWLGTVMGTMVLVGYLANKVLPGHSSDFVLEIPPMRVPVLGNTVIKTLARVEWYLKEVVPLFLLGTFVLWLLERLDLLRSIERFMAPVVHGFLGLPEQAADAFLIGFLRRDYGAAGLYNLFRPALATGHPSVETEIQIVVAMVTITLFVPCIANFFMIIKERGLATALWMSAFIFPFAFLVGGILNMVLRGVML